MAATTWQKLQFKKLIMLLIEVAFRPFIQTTWVIYQQPDKVLSLSLLSKWQAYTVHVVRRSLWQLVDLFWPNWPAGPLMNWLSVNRCNLPPLQWRRGYGFSKQLPGYQCVNPACCRCCKRSNDGLNAIREEFLQWQEEQNFDPDLDVPMWHCAAN